MAEHIVSKNQSYKTVNSVLYYTGSLEVGGAEVQLRNLLSSLVDVIPSRIVAYYESGPLEADYNATGAQLIRLEKGSGSYYQKLRTRWIGIKRIVEEHNPDLIHSQLPTTNLLACFALGNSHRPLIISERGLGSTRPFWEKALRRLAYQRASAFVTNSSAIQQRIISREKVPPGKTHIISNGIQMPAAKSSARKRVVEELALPHNSIVVTAVGSLSAVKGFDCLIQAIAVLRTKGKRICLVIAGEGVERSRLESIICSLEISDCVRLPGLRSDVPDILAASDIFASTSHSEGLSNSILEAMYSGLPTVATAVGGTVEIVKDGITGFLVPDSDSGMIASRLCQLAENAELRRTMGIRAKEYVRKNYSLEALAEKYMALYSSVIMKNAQV